MRTTRMRAVAVATMMLAAMAGHAAAQGATVPLGDFEHDAEAPVKITSDALALDQAAGTAIFSGTVRVAQGALRMASERLEVFYVKREDGGGADGGGAGAIDHMLASGDVTLTNGTETAEAARASYVVATGIVEMEGDVLLTQGPNALSGEKLRIDLEAGTGAMEGRVQTVITPTRKP